MLHVILDFVIPGCTPGVEFSVVGTTPVDTKDNPTIRITRECRVIGDDEVWADYTGRLWLASSMQQYMLHFENGVLERLVSMVDTDANLDYLKYLRVAGAHTLDRVTYQHTLAKLQQRRIRRKDSAWLQVKFLRRREGLSLAQAKALVRAVGDQRLRHPVPATYIVKYGQ